VCGIIQPRTKAIRKPNMSQLVRVVSEIEMDLRVGRFRMWGLNRKRRNKIRGKFCGPSRIEIQVENKEDEEESGM
jgi:hypothetical protein